MDVQNEIREFLSSRRARLAPEQVGLGAPSSKRRVPGLRREEVALLAGVSFDYYTRLERGNTGGVSDSVLEALSAALRLDEAERAHLLHLVHATRRRPRPRSAAEIRPSLEHLVNAITGASALIRNAASDILVTNPLCDALFAPLYLDLPRPCNQARTFFLEPRATTFYPDWDRMADRAVAQLRSETGCHPDDEDLTSLVQELEAGSAPFRRRWESHDVGFYDVSRLVSIRHPTVGEISLRFEAMPISGDQGLWMIAHIADPGSAAEEALAVLAESALVAPTA